MSNCQNSCGCCRTTRRGGFCTGTVSGFLAALLLFAVGLILGAYFAQQLLPAIAALIAFAAAIGAILIALLLFRLCRCD